jgi:hypothetical protein
MTAFAPVGLAAVVVMFILSSTHGRSNFASFSEHDSLGGKPKLSFLFPSLPFLP